jgi:hypothetical protein
MPPRFKRTIAALTSSVSGSKVVPSGNFHCFTHVSELPMISSISPNSQLSSRSVCARSCAKPTI